LVVRIPLIFGSPSHTYKIRMQDRNERPRSIHVNLFGTKSSFLCISPVTTRAPVAT